MTIALSVRSGGSRRVQAHWLAVGGAARPPPTKTDESDPTTPPLVGEMTFTGSPSIRQESNAKGLVNSDSHGHLVTEMTRVKLHLSPWELTSGQGPQREREREGERERRDSDLCPCPGKLVRLRRTSKAHRRISGRYELLL